MVSSLDVVSLIPAVFVVAFACFFHILHSTVRSLASRSPPIYHGSLDIVLYHYRLFYGFQFSRLVTYKQ